MHSFDTALGIVLAVLVLVAALGGVVWLDVGPIGRGGRALRNGEQARWPRTWRGWLVGEDPSEGDP